MNVLEASLGIKVNPTFIIDMKALTESFFFIKMLSDGYCNTGS